MDEQGLDRVVLPGGERVLKRRLHTNRPRVNPASLVEAWRRAYSSAQLRRMVEHEGFAPRDALLICFLHCFDEAGSKLTPYADVVEPGGKADRERHCAEGGAPPREPSLTTGIPRLVLELAENLERCKGLLKGLEAERRETSLPLKRRLREMEDEVRQSLAVMPESRAVVSLAGGEEEVVLSAKASRAKPPIGVKALKCLPPPSSRSPSRRGPLPDISLQEAERAMSDWWGNTKVGWRRGPRARLTRKRPRRR